MEVLIDSMQDEGFIKNSFHQKTIENIKRAENCYQNFKNLILGINAFHREDYEEIQRIVLR